MGVTFNDIMLVVPGVLFIILQLSPISDVKRFYVMKGTGQMSPLPYVALASNCCIWSTYGILIESPSIYIPNTSAIILSLAFTFIFFYYNATMSFLKRCSFIIAWFCFFIPSLMILMFVDVKLAITILGSTGFATAVYFTASPLIVARDVIRAKNTSALSLPLSVTVFLNCIAWTYFGLILVPAPEIWIPNAVGALCAVIQLSLFVIYGLPPPAVKEASQHDEGATMDMQLTDITTSSSTDPLVQEQEEVALHLHVATV